MLDQSVVLLDFTPLVKLRKGVLNYITKRMINGLSLGDQLYHVREETRFCVIQVFSKSGC
jgi:hypothetical protein